MQVAPEQIKRIQLILQALNFYTGSLDGIWGPKTIAAKKKFEASTSFTPGLPNGGMPFTGKPPYPAGITLDHATGLLYHPIIEKHLKSAGTNSGPGTGDSSTDKKGEVGPIGEPGPLGPQGQAGEALPTTTPAAKK